MRTKLAVVPLVAALCLAGTGVAHAEPVADIGVGGAAILSVDSPVTFKGSTASITFTYNCATDVEAMYLWASAKQLRQPTAVDDTWNFDTHGTSEQSAAWYDTHSMVPCTGEDETVTATIDKHLLDWTGQTTNQWRTNMRPGTAYVQLCLSTDEADESAPFAAYYEWVPVSTR